LRIVSLLSSATEILFALGLGEQVLAVSHECDYPPEATKLPRATRSLIDSSRPSHEIDQQVKERLHSGQSLYEIDRELIRRLEPGLIITQAQCDVCAVRYQDVMDFVGQEPSLTGTKVLALNPQSVGQILEDVLRIGEAAHCSDQAQILRGQLANRYSRVQSKLAYPWQNPKEFPRVVVIEWTEPLMAAGNWTPELVHRAGGASVLAHIGEPSGYVTWLDVVAARPDVLIVAPCGFNLERSMVEARRLIDWPGFNDLPAVSRGRAFVVDGNAYLNRSGPRIIDSLEIIAHLIRPDLFEAPKEDLAEGRAWSRLVR
jgi:iron complex transport system substrate-binding protein